MTTQVAPALIVGSASSVPESTDDKTYTRVWVEEDPIAGTVSICMKRNGVQNVLAIIKAAGADDCAHADVVMEAYVDPSFQFRLSENGHVQTTQG